MSIGSINLIVNNIVSEIVNKITDSAEKGRFEKNLLEYISNLYRKLQFTKTILIRNAPINFADNYVPLTIKNDLTKIRVNNPIHLVETYNHFTVIGNAGSGKSTLLQFIALKCIEEGHGIPVIIRLRQFNNTSTDIGVQLNFEKVVAAILNEENEPLIKEAFRKGQFIFILDGYDEIHHDQKAAFITQLESFIDKYSLNKFIISSRPNTDIEHLLTFFTFYIEPLNENDIYLFLQKLPISSQERISILNSIDNNDLTKQIINTPLFLSLYVLTHDYYTNYERKKSEFIRTLIDSLFHVHDSTTKIGYIRAKHSGLPNDTIEKIISAIAIKSFLTSKLLISKDDLNQVFDFSKRLYDISFDNEKLLYDLLVTVNIIRKDNNHYSFIHILVHEYLAAIFIANQKNSQEIYLAILKNNSLKLSTTFLEFIDELDYLNFTSYFILPMLDFFKDYYDEIITDKSTHTYYQPIINYITNKYLPDNQFSEKSVLSQKRYFSVLIENLNSQIKHNQNTSIDWLLGNK